MKTITEKNINDLIGIKARLWDFSPSHDRLSYLLKDETQEQKYLIFIFSEKMNINPCWKISEPKITKGNLSKYKLVDGEIEIYFEECVINNEYKIS